jgi:hypothetical protein
LISGQPWSTSVSGADVDGDGDTDVVSASIDGTNWYRNTDGAGNFGPRIDIDFEDTDSVFAADVDGDDDIDVLRAGEDLLSWHENLDGAGSFGPGRPIHTNEIFTSVTATDVDGDGHLDVISTARPFAGNVSWYENLDGKGNFGPQQIMSSDVPSYPRSVFADDIDDDGDMDAVSVGNDGLAWHENLDGFGSFGAAQWISTSIDSGWSVFGADVDGDGDADILTASLDDNKIAWYRVLDDGAGTACDCALDPSILPPPEVLDLHVEDLGAGSARLTWSTASGADSYSVTRVLLSDLAPGLYGICLEDQVPGGATEFVDSDPPAAGDGYGYLINGVSFSCGPGTLGFATGGVERINEHPAACP